VPVWGIAPSGRGSLESSECGGGAEKRGRVPDCIRVGCDKALPPPAHPLTGNPSLAYTPPAALPPRWQTRSLTPEPCWCILCSLPSSTFCSADFRALLRCPQVEKVLHALPWQWAWLAEMVGWATPRETTTCCHFWGTRAYSIGCLDMPSNASNRHRYRSHGPRGNYATGDTLTDAHGRAQRRAQMSLTRSKASER